MALVYLDAGTILGTGASRTISYPATTVAGNVLVLVIANKDGADIPETPSGWTAAANHTTSGGAGTDGTADEGTARISAFYRIADGTEGGTTFTFTLSGSPKPVSARVYRFSKGPGSLSVACATGAQNTGGSTTYSITTGADPGLEANDLVLACTAINTDAYLYSSHAFSASGVTYGTSVERQDSGNTNGTQCRIVVAECPVLAGTSTGNTTYSTLASGSVTNAPAGATVIIRLREVGSDKVKSRASFTETVSQNGHSGSITLASGSSRKLVVCASTEFSTQTITAATFDDSNLTLIQNTKHTVADIRQHWYYYDIPDATASGSKTISFTTSANATAISYHAWILHEIAAGAPAYASVVESAATASSATTNASVGAVSSGVLLASGTNASATPVVSSWEGVWGTAENNETNYTSAAADLSGTSGATASVTVTWNSTSGDKLLGTMVFSGVSSSLSITSVTPSQIDSGESFTIAGTGFGATQGLSLVQIGGVTQTPTSWSDTSITCTATRGSQSMGNATLTIYKM